jgi:hypothetical protein
MEDVLSVYQLPYDPDYPVICMDEASRQLIGEITHPLPRGAGQPRKVDYEYVRNGVCNQLVVCEPLRGWRRIQLRERRTKKDWARCIRELVEVHYPQARKIRLVLDNLNTHAGGSLYETFPAAQARWLAERLEFHYTPKHASWLNMAEIEIRILSQQCLDRRIESMEQMEAEVGAWERTRNAKQARIHWTFTVATARHKMKKVYPSIEG